jgi:hypothetical protein
VFGAAALGIIEGFGVIVEVFFGPGRFELPFAGPLDAVPAVSVIGRGFGHEEVLAYQEPNRAANQQVEGLPGKQKAEWRSVNRRRAMDQFGLQAVGWRIRSTPHWRLGYSDLATGKD